MKNFAICCVLFLGLLAPAWIQAQADQVIEAHLWAGYSYPEYGSLNADLSAAGFRTPVEKKALEQQFYLRMRRANKRLGYHVGFQGRVIETDLQLEPAANEVAFRTRRLSGWGFAYGLFYELLPSERFRLRPSLGLAQRYTSLRIQEGDDFEHLLSPSTTVEQKTFNHFNILLDAGLEAAVVVWKERDIRVMLGLSGKRLQAFTSRPWQFEDSFDVSGLGKARLGGWQWGLTVDTEFGVAVKKGEKLKKS
ncbi:MAG: hypothetical protein D6765_01365 [Bacteroidetes bacterium]|nr:MAG: hypothetical protein D6765_01365 [Bacteroidota bacterium]